MTIVAVNVLKQRHALEYSPRQLANVFYKLYIFIENDELRIEAYFVIKQRVGNTRSERQSENGLFEGQLFQVRRGISSRRTSSARVSKCS